MGQTGVAIKIWGWALACVLAAGTAQAQEQPTQSVQQIFDAAAAATGKGDHAAAAAMLATLEQLHMLGHPLLIGLSRKSMLGAITGRDVNERLPASLAAATIAAMKGASIIRVHDVRETVDAIRVVAAVKEAG